MTEGETIFCFTLILGCFHSEMTEKRFPNLSNTSVPKVLVIISAVHVILSRVLVIYAILVTKSQTIYLTHSEGIKPVFTPPPSDEQLR